MRFLLLPLLTLFVSIQAYALEVGDNAPCVVIPHIAADGTEFDQCIREPNTQGQLKVLEFFSAVCSTCQKNLPRFSSLENEFGKDVTFRLVGIDRSEQLLRDYISSRKPLINFDVALDTEREARRAYDVISTPTLFVLDQNDVVLYKHEGLLKKKDIKALKAIFKADIANK